MLTTKNYKELYEQKCSQFEQLNLQFTQYQQQTNFIITDLQQEVKELKKKGETSNKQLYQLKQKRKNFNNTYEKQIELARKEKEQFKNKFMEFEKKVIELENINQSLQSDLRATKATLSEYQQRTEKTMQQLALLQIQMEESTEHNQQQIARLKSQLKQTQDELYALHHAKTIKNQQIFMNEKKQKQNNQHDQSFHSKQSGNRKSQFAESKVKKRNPKFAQTLSQLRGYIKQISVEGQKIGKKFEEHLL